ncbi:MAG TPA: LURP-one-related family protein [Thermoleophilaceae bacterium]|nr:LURP-one-related family protein [Thermoleophilaceae bacterium]
MGFLRHRSDEPEGERFHMREKLLAIGDDFWIENDRGERAYKVNGKALRVRQTFVLEDASGDEVARIQSASSASATRSPSSATATPPLPSTRR